MNSTVYQRIKKFLRSPAIVVAEIVVIMVAGILGTLIPQTGSTDRVFQSGWFLCAVALAFASLSVVAIDQIRRLVKSPSRHIAPFGGVFIHVGLLLVILSATLKTLFGGEAVVDLLEGEILPSTAVAWAVQKPGALAGPLQLDHPLVLESVDARRYPAGDLEGLSVRLRFPETATKPLRSVDIPVNGSIETSGVKLFVGADYGPAALLEWRDAAGAMIRSAALLKYERGQRFEGVLTGPDGARAYLRMEGEGPGLRAAGVEVRVMKDTALLVSGMMRAGTPLLLPSGGALTLRGTPFWVRLHARRDPALWLLYFGFALVIFGVTARFALVPLPRPASVVVLIGVLGLTGCSGGGSRPEAKQLVERYNRVVAEAYRRGDVKLVDSVVGPDEGRKLTGLIGVRLDLGLTLDSQMLSLDVLEARQSKGELQVRTRERWSYCDRRIGSGAQVGETSVDAYEMRYYFKRFGRDWLVDRIEFAEPPRFGRPPATWAVAHGREQGRVPDKADHKERALP